MLKKYSLILLFLFTDYYYNGNVVKDGNKSTEAKE